MLRYLLVAACLVAACYSILIARADYLFQKDTATSVARALELVPYNADYAARLAAWTPGEQRALLTRSVSLNPFEFRAWIQLGLLAEMQEGDPVTAERDYARAAEVNKMFLPKWTLMNFYLRQSREKDFFRWAKLTLEITPHSPNPVFRQMWYAAQDPAKIADYIPNRPTVLVQYALFLSSTHHFAAIPPVIGRLVAHPGDRTPADLGRDELIGPMEDQLLDAGDVQDALQIWRSLSEAGWIHLPVPTTAHPLINGDFHSPFFGHGFDWVPGSCPEASVEQDRSAGVVRIFFSGVEAECTLLSQQMPVTPGKVYRLQWRSTANSGAAEGLHWYISSAQKEPGTGGTLDFRVPDNTNVLVLALAYSHPQSALLASGSFELRSVSLSAR